MSLISLEYATKAARTIGAERREGAFRDYVRWEYPPADRAYVILGARGGAVMYLARTPAKQAVPRPAGRLTRWFRAVRKAGSPRTVDEAAAD